MSEKLEIKKGVKKKKKKKRWFGFDSEVWGAGMDCGGRGRDGGGGGGGARRLKVQVVLLAGRSAAMWASIKGYGHFGDARAFCFLILILCDRRDFKSLT